MTKQEHKYAQALRWIAGGESLQIRWGKDTRWMELPERNEIVMDEILRGAGEYEFRIKPRTIMIGDVECEAPIKELAKGEVCYLLNLPAEKLEQPAHSFMRSHDVEKAISKGMMFATPEAAIAAGIAVSKLLTQQ